MNLIEAFNAFDSWTRLNTLNANQRSLYIAIMQLWNAAGRHEYSTIPEQKLTELSGLSKKTFYNNRDKLEELGLIEVVKSKKKSIAPKYKLLDVSVKNDDYFTPEITPKEDSSVKKGSDFTPISTPNLTPDVTPISTPNLTPYTEKRIEEERRENNNNMSGKLDKKIPYSEIIDYLNKKTGRGFKNVEANKKLIKARWNEGYKLEDFKTVIDNMTVNWRGKEFNGVPAEHYLQPKTLFSNKFDSYLNQKPVVKSHFEDHSNTDINDWGGWK